VESKAFCTKGLTLPGLVHQWYTGTTTEGLNKMCMFQKK
jgi:hypothetical protein